MWHSSQSLHVIPTTPDAERGHPHVRCLNTHATEAATSEVCDMTDVLYRGQDSQPEGFEDRVIVDAGRPTPIDWVRTRKAERDTRREEAAHSRLYRRVGSLIGHLGDEWHVLDLRELGGAERTGFLAVGPGGVF